MDNVSQTQPRNAAALVVALVAIPFAFWIRQQGMGAFVLALLVLLLAPMLFGVVLRKTFFVFVPAALFNVLLAATLSYLAATRRPNGVVVPFTWDSLTTMDAKFLAFAFIASWLVFVPVLFRKSVNHSNTTSFGDVRN